jgi:hypothetical protein
VVKAIYAKRIGIRQPPNGLRIREKAVGDPAHANRLAAEWTEKGSITGSLIDLDRVGVLAHPRRRP